jgi:hypothetical protein
MKKIIVLIFILIVTIGCSSGQATFQKTFGDINIDEGYVVYQIQNGYILCGWRLGNIFTVIKTDLLGNLIWTRTLPSINVSSNCVIEANDGSFVVSGTRYLPSFYSEFALMKIDVNGNILWNKSYYGASPSYNYGGALQQTSDHGYIMCGYTMATSFNYDACLLRTDSMGNLLWAKTYGDAGLVDDRASSVQETIDKGFIIAGTARQGGGIYDIYLVKTDSAGNMLWNNTFTGADVEFGYSVKQTTDKGYFIVGETYSFTSGYKDIFAIKTDSTGSVAWTKNYGNPGAYSSGTSGQQTNDGGFIISGVYYQTSPADIDGILIKTDNMGNVTWARKYGGPLPDSLAYVQQCSDNGFIAVGTTESFGAGDKDIYLVKTDPQGNSGCNDSLITLTVGTPTWATSSYGTNGTFGIAGNATDTLISPTIITTTVCLSTSINNIYVDTDISLFPNPAIGQITIYNLQFTIKSLEIYDVLGQRVFSQDQTTNYKLQTHTIDISNLNSGVYFLKVKGNQKERVAKFVKQ